MKIIEINMRMFSIVLSLTISPTQEEEDIKMVQTKSSSNYRVSNRAQTCWYIGSPCLWQGRVESKALSAVVLVPNV